MRPDYRLVRLKAETVQHLNRLKDDTGQASLNDLIAKMIHLTDAYRHDAGLILPRGCSQPPLQ